jgi:hypothetical protein
MLISQLPVEESLSSLTACARLRQVISRPSGLAHATVLLVEEHVRLRPEVGKKPVHRRSVSRNNINYKKNLNFYTARI